MAGDKQATATKAHGYFVAEGWYGEKTELDTLQCCHCGLHFPVRPGSGKRRGFCLLCSAITCGREMCDVCVPKMRQIENMEQGRNRFFRPVNVSVPADVPRSCTAADVPRSCTAADVPRSCTAADVPRSCTAADVPKAHLKGGILLGDSPEC